MGYDKTTSFTENSQGIDVYFGALSNLINALVLFDEVFYIKNGYEISWQRYTKFSEKLERVIQNQSIENPDMLRVEIGNIIDTAVEIRNSRNANV